MLVVFSREIAFVVSFVVALIGLGLFIVQWRRLRTGFHSIWGIDRRGDKLFVFVVKLPSSGREMDGASLRIAIAVRESQFSDAESTAQRLFEEYLSKQQLATIDRSSVKWSKGRVLDRREVIDEGPAMQRLFDSAIASREGRSLLQLS